MKTETLKTKSLIPGDILSIRTGCRYLKNITISEQEIVGICKLGFKIYEISFKSGLVIKSGSETEHKRKITCLQYN